MKLHNAIAQTVYPDGIKCIVCDNELTAESRYSICPDCSPERIANFCLQCGCKIIGTKSYCDNCLIDDRQFDVARAPFCFEIDDVRRLVYGLKYGDKTYLAKYLAEFMTDTYFAQDWTPDVITYVPLHPIRQIITRGYNQSKLIARHISELIGVECQPLLKKTKHSNKNVAVLRKSERKELLENSFEVIADVKGKKILLIDDVMTTGATCEECAKMLKQAKAKRVWVLTFATSAEHAKLFDPKDDNEKLQKLIVKAKKKKL